MLNEEKPPALGKSDGSLRLALGPQDETFRSFAVDFPKDFRRISVFLGVFNKLQYLLFVFRCFFQVFFLTFNSSSDGFRRFF